MRKLNKRKATRKEPENLSDASAWLYTDLLLGLAVAFLGAGTFLVRSQTDTVSSPSVVLTYQLSCNEVILDVPRSISPNNLDLLAVNTINDASIIEEWNEPKVGILQISGGTGGGPVSEGTRNATAFRDNIISETPSLNNAEKLIQADTSLSQNQIKLRIYVVYKGDEAKNGC